MTRFDLCRALMHEALAAGSIRYETDGPSARNLRWLCYKLREAARAQGDKSYDELRFSARENMLHIRRHSP